MVNHAHTRSYQFQFHHHLIQRSKSSNTSIAAKYFSKTSPYRHLLQQQYHKKYNAAGVCRNYCTQVTSVLTHIDTKGKAYMVDVSEKNTTTREATACATVIVGQAITELIHANNIKKGDVLSIAQFAGILGAKKTADLIPLCHNIVLSSVKVEAELQQARHTVELTAKVRCCGQTGVEMEALTAVSVAALTVYDMCKAVSHDITITNIRLMSKSGGKRVFERKNDRIDDDKNKL